ncbi:MAG: 7-cyano-7-deazaguanine synthase [Candidatus Methanofastidiosia archaeon]|jgi:7-cyano-7-deazaguanine synthase in queuosine biosynthesis
MKGKTPNIYIKDTLPKKKKLKYDSETDLIISYLDNRGHLRVKYPFDIFKIESEREKNRKLCQDLLNISFGLFIADKYLPRKELVNIHLGVSDLLKWQRHQKELRNTIYALTGENYGFEFYQKEEKTEKLEKQPPMEADMVCLFSGGIDSFCGYVNLLENNKVPLAVSISTSGNLNLIQKLLFKEICKKHPIINKSYQNLYNFLPRSTNKKFGKKLEKLRNIRKKEWMVSFRSRSFLFLSFASILAVMYDLKEIFIPENGIMALIDEIRISPSYSGTRTAHPQFIYLYENFISKIFEDSIKISNPFQFKTKTQIVKNSSQHDLLIKTESCAYYSRRRQHCGYCIPCIMRRISMKAAELNDVAYEFDVFDFPDIEITADWEKKKEKDAYMAVMSLIELTQTIMESDRRTLLIKYPILEDPNIFGLYNQFATETQLAFSKFAQKYEIFGTILKKMTKKE